MLFSTIFYYNILSQLLFPLHNLCENSFKWVIYDMVLWPVWWNVQTSWLTEKCVVVIDMTFKWQNSTFFCALLKKHLIWWSEISVSWTTFLRVQLYICFSSISLYLAETMSQTILLMFFLQISILFYCVSVLWFCFACAIVWPLCKFRVAH